MTEALFYDEHIIQKKSGNGRRPDVVIVEISRECQDDLYRSVSEKSLISRKGEAAMNQMKRTGMKFKVLFSSKMITTCVLTVLMGYVTVYATNYMGLSAASVGIAFMVSKIFDGFTDFMAGMLIDRTKTRLGQARPYDLALIGYGAAVIFLFSAPNLSEHAGLVYLFIMYTMVNSVFSTLVSCNEAPYLSNAVEKSEDCVSVTSFGAIISLFATLIAAIIIPQLISTMGTTKAGWSKLSFIIVIPSVLVGLIRFLTIREIRTTTQDTAVKAEQSGNSLENIKYFFKNKYILLFGVILLLSNICSNISNMNYYCIYILGDIGYASIFSLSVFSVIFALITMPKLSKNFGTMKVLMVCAIIGALGYLIKLLGITSIPIGFISALLANLGFYPIWFMASEVIVDTMDYGEWRFGKRTPGILGCATGIASKIGTAVGTGLLGVLMGLAGFDGLLEVQSQGAINMIVTLTTIVPSAICVVIAILCKVYDLDKKLPMIREDLAKKAEEA
ncbi:MAG: MFS transporter [Lachnospiraceae bacterium]|nr:MFS transporter [Lachnospiraceae bacterium]